MLYQIITFTQIYLLNYVHIISCTWSSIFTYVHASVCTSHIWSRLSNLSFPQANDFKFMYKVRVNKRKIKFDLRLYPFFCSGVMPLFTLAGTGGIRFLWVHSSIFFCYSYSHVNGDNFAALYSGLNYFELNYNSQTMFSCLFTYCFSYLYIDTNHWR